MASFAYGLWTLLLFASATILSVDNNAQVFSPDEPQVYANLTSALLASVEPYLEVQFLLPLSQEPYELQALGMHQLIFRCKQSHISVTATLMLMAGTGVEFQDCHIERGLSAGALVAVFGSLKLTDGSVKNNDAKGFVLFGQMQVSGTIFEGNRDSIFAAQSFGFQLDVREAVFQANTSPAGVVLLLGIAGTGITAVTSIRFDECTFFGNMAYLGGSFMHLSVSLDIEFAPLQLAEQRSIEIRNCVFDTNPGFLVIAFSKYMNVTFSENAYSNHNYGFLVDLYDSSFTISSSTVSTISRFFISRYISGLLSLKGLKIYNVVEGPAIVLRNDAPISSGLVSLDDIEMRNVTLLDSTPFSAVLTVINVAIRVTNLHVSEGYTYACACGCYWFSAALIDSPQMANMTAEQGAMLAFLGSVVEVNNAYMWNVTLTRVSLTGAFISTVTFRNTTFIPGPSSYAIDRIKVNMHISFDSTVYIYNAYYDLPPLHTSPAYYIWASTFECTNITYTKLYSRMADVYLGSRLILKDVTVMEGYIESIMLVAMGGYAVVEHLTFRNFEVELAFFTVLSDSVAVIKDVKLDKVKFSALLIASNSKVSLSDLTFRNIEADTLFLYITSCQMNITNLSAFDSKFDLMQFTGGFASLKSITLQRVTVRRRFITLRSTAVEFEGVIIDDLTATSVTPFCFVQKSLISFHASTFRHFRSREQGLMQLSNSLLLFIRSEVSDFNVTFISASRSAISVLSSTVREGGLRLMDVGAKAKVSAGLVDAEDSAVLLEHSRFEGVTGMNGGVVSIESRRNESSITVQSCSFEGCGALKDGGIIRAISANVTVMDSSLTSNTAERGGCIYFACSSISQCSSSISSSRFINNTAREGGVLKWTFIKPSLAGNYEASNTAEYGPFEASIPTHMSLFNANASALCGVPGVIVVEPILIAFLDVMNQTVASDFKCAAKLTSDSIIGTTYLLAENGVANFSSVIVQSEPGANLTVEVFSPTINSTFPNSSGAFFSFEYRTRKCIVGEVSTPTGCFLCPKNTFSVHPTDPECNECPKYATCPGAFSLILDKGYWRSSTHSDVVSLCPVTEACEGGQNSTCNEGYTDKMCMKCEERYYALGQVNCAKCESLWIRVFRSFVMLGGATIFSILLIRQTFAFEDVTETKTSFIIRKILINFLHSLLILPLIGVSWKPELLHLVSAVEMLFSFALTSIVTECMSAQGDTWKPVFVRALLASALPFCLFIVTGVVFLIRRMLQCRKVSFRHYYQSCLVLLYIIHPFITKSAASLVICMKIESESYWLVGDVSVKCWESGHLLFLYALFLPMSLLLIVGIPALSISTILVMRKRPHRKVIHFFLVGYTHSHQLWECGILVSKSLVFLTASLLRLSESIIQIILILSVLYCLMEWQIRKKPFTSPLLNKLEGFSRFFQFLLAGTSFYYQVQLNMYPVVLFLLAICSVVVVCGFVAVLVVIDVRYVRKAQRVTASKALEISPSIENPSMQNPSGVDFLTVTVEVKEERIEGNKDG